MSISIGIDCTPGHWRVCRVEQGQLAEYYQFGTAGEMLVVVRQLCARYPEPTIVVALNVAAPFILIATLSDEQLERLVRRYHPTPLFNELIVVLQSLRTLSSHSYCAPSVEYLPAVPLHRLLMRPILGSAGDVCAAIALLHYMREQQASWEEMNFFCINVGEHGTSVLVLIDGQVVNGIDVLQGSSWLAASGYLASLGIEQGMTGNEIEQRAVLQPALDQAFWEGLTQELSGLLAVHHIEDMVVLGQKTESLVERLAETYQVYLFPHVHPEHEGYETALGAALLGEGREQPGSSAAVVERLQIRQAQRAPLMPA